MNYWDHICELQKKQTEKGIKNYGQRLEENTELDPFERLTMLEEELIDGLMYIEHCKQAFKDLQEENLIRSRIMANQDTMIVNYKEIIHIKEAQMEFLEKKIKLLETGLFEDDCK